MTPEPPTPRPAAAPPAADARCHRPPRRLERRGHPGRVPAAGDRRDRRPERRDHRAASAASSDAELPGDELGLAAGRDHADQVERQPRRAPGGRRVLRPRGHGDPEERATPGNRPPAASTGPSASSARHLDRVRGRRALPAVARPRDPHRPAEADRPDGRARGGGPRRRWSFPLSEPLRPEPAWCSAGRPTIEALYVPDIDASLDEQGAKRPSGRRSGPSATGTRPSRPTERGRGAPEPPLFAGDPRSADERTGALSAVAPRRRSRAARRERALRRLRAAAARGIRRPPRSGRGHPPRRRRPHEPARA